MRIDAGDRHVDEGTARAYAGGVLDAAGETFVEAHSLRCGDCRLLLVSSDAAARTSEDSARLDRLWANVVDAVDAPRRTVVERVLQRLGVGADTARLIAVTPSLQLPWLLAVVGALVFAVVAALAGPRGVGVFLVVAPVLPVLAVAAVYGPALDPLHEISTAVPYSSARLVLLRSAAALAVTLPLVCLTGLALPAAPWWVAAAWLLPATAFTVLALLVGTFVEPLTAAVGIAAGWLVAVGAGVARHADPLVLVRPAAQLLFLGLLAAATVGLFARRGASAGTGWPA